MTRRDTLLWGLGAVGTTILVWCCNLGGAWWADNARWYNVLTTAAYIAFWVAFTYTARGRGRVGTALLAAAVLHFVSALCSLLARLALKGLLPAALSDVAVVGALANPFAAGVMFYGLSALAGRDWTAMYALETLLTATWVIWCAVLRRNRKRGRTNTVPGERKEE